MPLKLDKPHLRSLDFQPVTYEGEPMWLLHDPLQLSSQQLILPPALAQMVLFCDGTRNVEEIRRAFHRQFELWLPLDVVKDALNQLDGACLLENERSQQALAAQLEAFRARPHRPPALAGPVYPADPIRLTGLLNHFADGDHLDGWTEWRGRGIISPHIDYQRGGPVYAKVWRRAAAAVQEADLVLIFGTDHNGSPGRVTLTRLPYATPYGVLPAAPDVVEQVAAALGSQAFDEELHHRTEHSVELSAVWLHHVRQQAGLPPCPMAPILCGSFHHFVGNGRHPADDPHLTAAITALQEATAGRRVLAVASVDLAHVGPNFGDSFPMDSQRRARLVESDGRLLEAITNGDAGRFYHEVASVGDRNRICGFSSIYLMLRYLGATAGVTVAYEQCPADPQNTSLVSICGLLLE